MKVFQEPKDYTDKLERLQQDYKEASERKEVSGSPQQQANVAKEVLELSGTTKSPIQSFPERKRDVSPSQVSNSSVPQTQEKDGYVIEGVHYQNKSLEEQVFAQEFDKMEDVKHEEQSDSDSSHTEQEMDEDKQQVYNQGKSMLQEELNKTFQNFEHHEKVTPT